VPPPLSLSEWSLPLLQCIDWKRFEGLCAEVLSWAGYEVRFTTEEPDIGIDLILRSPGSDEEDVAVRCVQRAHPIKLSVVQQFYEASLGARMEKAMFMTTTHFTVPVYREYGEDEGFEFVDGSQMLEGMAELGGSAARYFLNFAIEGEDWFVPTCMQCGIKMSLRRPGRKSECQEPFWGCLNFARSGCREILTLPGTGQLRELALGIESSRLR
jgi:hypothetical protein